ncbi:YidC/Oxa1 family membrane protein insertase [Peptostreptococcus faecalis]|uniref:YidC/Oxa1 family membrane protein insertase n=1 Tax=Peptostreptococcus faecalis TaxID=2045015 RepID=UPI000C7D851B|nr:YidC/Oxa1 family membrane protein insertase [Peptostreptococcus faecalis]
MGIIAGFFGTILSYIYGAVGSYGLSIIIFTVIVKAILTPLTIKQTKSTFAMSEINPKIKEIQEKYKNKPEKQNEEISRLYKESGFNPLAGCLPMLIQMPILFGLFYVFRDPVAHGVFANKAAFMAANGNFLWIQSLIKPDYVLAALSGISAYFMQIAMTPKDQLQGTMKIMTWVMAGMSFYWGFIFPAALALYWTVSNLFSVAQYFVITRPLKKRLALEKEERDAKKAIKGKK